MRTSRVYFLRPVGWLGPVKVGVSNNTDLRLESYAAWSPIPLELVATIPGDRRLEIIIHRFLWPSHSHREWFHATAEVVSFVDAIVAGASIDALIDISAMSKTKLGLPRPGWTPEGRAKLKYSARLGAAERKGRGIPVSIRQTVVRWRGGIKPSVQDFAAMDAFLSEAAP